MPGEGVQEIKYNVFSLMDFPSPPKSRQHHGIGVVNRDSSTAGPEKRKKSLSNIPF